MICKKCGKDLPFKVKAKGPHVGAYCSNCDAWIKWLNKKERIEYGKQNNAYETDITIDEIIDDEVPW